ncbi:DUF2238 domain-containing protein [Alloalcanivorax profundimaris]|uniref:DUF2238 domain-containing protein n=1 Tax=Alloalcanivorax profundimaris TaxID=2735259 RepID=UPI000C3696FE|nr:DUF2238 domain-containing protein [Alloalcanivorax profundimaris]MAO58923.1 hypothetical protein [Alcanivorax sp.]MAY09116.1 hypothetical protein [Alcanivorax sp.]MBF1803552.1 DUF2238 domain-containing protein [Alloalcanivorax profundimaris]MBI53987.1 hypothetical protein [Alcanivorax sp.]MBU57625.1 hypothetical protein [Alcanivorax sp.]|tara:strand:- start:380 stop:1021 length:642 start_codon:yes stop_codon:yes gene_type:complete
MDDRKTFMAYTAILLVVMAALAVSPVERETWLMENAVVALFLATLWATRRWFRFSAGNYGLITLFLVLHEIGAHYTYSRVPYDAWARQLAGFSIDELFGWQRNQYDRLLHLLYGVLLVLPLRELCRRVAGLRGAWAGFFAFALILASSMIYELIEWGAAVVLGDGSDLFLGTQGDPWDAQKDMALALLGALIALALAAPLRAARVRRAVTGNG